MKKIIFTLYFLGFSVLANASPTRWELIDFKFNDGGSAYGSFIYDYQTDTFSNIDVYTTKGSMLNGRHFIATAGDWGRSPQYGVLSFSDSSGPDFTGAGWFRIDALIDFNASYGTVVNQWLAVGAESFCVNSSCSSAANEISYPGKSRDTISGYLIATSPVPEPSSFLLGAVGLSTLLTNITFARRNKQKKIIN